jgi:hypothetical protein
MGAFWVVHSLGQMVANDRSVKECDSICMIELLLFKNVLLDGWMVAQMHPIPFFFDFLLQFWARDLAC